MLDVHPPHGPTHTWKDFFIHIATIVVGLLIAVGLEQAVEYFHHRREISETRDALVVEQEQNQQNMAVRLAEFRLRVATVQTNLAVFHYLEMHPRARLDMLPGKVNWHTNGTPFTQSVWTTAQQSPVLALLPPAEVREDSKVYRLMQYCSDSFAAYRAANTEARTYTVDAASVTDLSPEQVKEQIRLTRITLNRLYRYGADLRNLAVLYPRFSPVPTVEELAQIVHETAAERAAIESQSLGNEEPKGPAESDPASR